MKLPHSSADFIVGSWLLQKVVQANSLVVRVSCAISGCVYLPFFRPNVPKNNTVIEWEYRCWPKKKLVIDCYNTSLLISARNRRCVSEQHLQVIISLLVEVQSIVICVSVCLLRHKKPTF